MADVGLGVAVTPSTVLTVRYTCPAATTAYLREVSASNYTAGAVTLLVKAKGKVLVPTRSIGAGGEYQRTGVIILSAGETIQDQAGANTSIDAFYSIVEES